MSANVKTMTRLAPVFALLAGFFWGSEGTFVRVLTGYGMNNFTILGTRLLGATIMLAIIILVWNRSKFKINPKDIVLFIIVAFFGSVALNYCYNEAINSMTLSLAAVLLDLCPVYTIIISFFIFHEKITGRKILTLLMALAGVLLLTGIGTSNVVWTAHGLIFGLLSGIFYATYGLISKGFANKGYTSTTMTFYSVLFGAIICAPLTDWGKTVDILQTHGGTALVMMLLNSACASMLPYLLFAASLMYMDAGKASIFTTIEPAAAMFLGFIIFKEVPTGLNLLGMAIVIAALIILDLPEKISGSSDGDGGGGDVSDAAQQS